MHPFRLFLFCAFTVITGAWHTMLLAQGINTPLSYAVHQPSIKTGKTPVLIMMHGYGSNEEDLLSLADQLDGRLMTFSLRAPRARQGDGFCWYELQFLENGQFNYNYDQVVQSRNQVLAFISQACRVYGLDSSQVYLMGFSQGAIMCYDISLFSPDKIKGVMALSGRLMKETQLHKANWNTGKLSFFIGHGTSDKVIAISESQTAAEFLSKQGIGPVTFKTYNMPHSISEAEVQDMKQWLGKCLITR